jgi:hypothetical protein
MWDDFCATTGFAGGCGAQVLCENQPCYIPPPENDLCEDAIPINDGGTGYSNIGTATDGINPIAPQCEEGFGLIINSDIWYEYTSTCSGTVTVSTCNNASYDSRFAMYEGCGSCPPTNDTLVGCNDDGDGCGLSSEMTAFVTQGTCYLIRAGGFGGAQGTGTITITCDAVNEACLGSTGDCLTGHMGVGCNDAECCDTVCDIDSFCCDFQWDSNCAAVAELNCFDPPNPACVNAQGSCLEAHPTPGCNDEDCCTAICDFDPFCCMTEWDAQCVGEAIGFGCGGGQEPANNACANSIDVSEGIVMFTTINATTDGPALPMICEEGAGLSFMNDVWYDFTPSQTGDATISLCEGTAYDARISIYTGCQCPASNANLLGCDDDGCGFIGAPSLLTVPVVAGTCYKLRIGGFDVSEGEGIADISVAGIPCPDVNVQFTSPAPGAVDARQNNTPAGGSLLGITSVTAMAPVGEDIPDGCFVLCETSTGGMAPNSIASIVPGTPGMRTINFSRPITPNAVTKLTYMGTGASASYAYHPANANGDSAANPLDILRLIDYLNGIAVPPWGLLSTDIDRSGVAGPADILRLIDLLNGAGALDVWNNTALPTNPGICP